MNKISDLQIHLFGAVEVMTAGMQGGRFEYDKVRALLAYIAVEGRMAIRRDTLTGLLWPEQDDKAARHSLSQALTSLRRSIRDENARQPILLIDRNEVQLNLKARWWIDVHEFIKILGESQRHAHIRLETCEFCAQQHLGALSLYRGPFLEGLSISDCAEFEVWVLTQRETYHRLALESAGHLTQYHEWRGELEQARRYAEQQIKFEPWREEAHRQLMRLLAHSGQRTAALRQYEVCQRLLDAELGVEPDAATTALYASIKRAGGALPHNLPTLPTLFVGRKQEVSTISAFLAAPDCRLVTVIGPGGMGKTRLALQVAQTKLPAFLHGVYFVSLTGIDTTDALVGAVAHAVGATFPGTGDNWVHLGNFLRQRELLLLLDNFEQLVDKVSLLDELLQMAPQIKLLITSRMRLQSTWEWVYELKGLPTLAQIKPDSVDASTAAYLFVERARRLLPNFVLDATNQVEINRICNLVEGLPLAIELAATWTRALSCAEIEREIDQGLSLLNQPTDATDGADGSDLYSVFERSWRLLAPAAQSIYAQLSVFRVGFSRAAAEAVTDISLSQLTTLVDASLLRLEESGRYSMHELLRKFAAQKLAALPTERTLTVGRFTAYFVKRIEFYSAPFARHRQQFEEMQLDMENIRSVWQLLLAAGDSSGIDRCLDGLYRFHEIHNWDRQGAELFDTARQSLAIHGQTDAVCARIGARLAAFRIRLSEYEHAVALLQDSLHGVRIHQLPAEEAFCLLQMGSAIQHLGKYNEARSHYRASLLLASQLDDQPGMSAALHHLGHLAYDMGDYPEAIDYFDQSLAIKQKLDDEWGVANTLNNLGIAFYALGHLEDADQCYRTSLTKRRRLGSQWGIAAVLNNLGLISMDQGDDAGAAAQFEESLAICAEIGDERGVAIASNNLGELATAQGDFKNALQYHGRSLEIFLRIGHASGIMFSLNFLGYASMGRGSVATAARHFSQALTYFRDNPLAPRALDSLLGLAQVYARRQLPQRALDLLATILVHRATEQNTRQRAKTLYAALLDRHGLSDISALTGRQVPDLEVLAADVLRDPSLLSPEL